MKERPECKKRHWTYICISTWPFVTFFVYGLKLMGKLCTLSEYDCECDEYHGSC
jgi:hypothetical protein